MNAGEPRERKGDPGRESTTHISRSPEDPRSRAGEGPNVGAALSTCVSQVSSGEQVETCEKKQRARRHFEEHPQIYGSVGVHSLGTFGETFGDFIIAEHFGDTFVSKSTRPGIELSTREHQADHITPLALPQLPTTESELFITTRSYARIQYRVYI